MRILPALLLCAAMAAQAQPTEPQGPAPAADAAERARIESERRQAEERFAAQEKACYQRFAVTDCIEQAREALRATQRELRRREAALNEATRRARGAERLREIEERSSPQRQQAAGERRERAQSQAQQREAAAADKGHAPKPGGKPRPADAGGVSPPSHVPDDPAGNAARHARKVEEAQQHKERVERKAAERTKPRAAPLPVPPP